MARLDRYETGGGRSSPDNVRLSLADLDSGLVLHLPTSDILTVYVVFLLRAPYVDSKNLFVLYKQVPPKQLGSVQEQIFICCSKDEIFVPCYLMGPRFGFTVLVTLNTR